MNRRSLLRLATTGSVLGSLAGCLDPAETSSSGITDSSPTEPENATEEPYVESPLPLEEVESPRIGEDCGQASLPLSALLQGSPQENQKGEISMAQGTPGIIVLENEREVPVQIDVTVDSPEEDSILEASFDLEPNERITYGYDETEKRLSRPSDYTFTVTVNEEAPETGSLRGDTASRHGIAILPEGVAMGFEHNVKTARSACYAGDEQSVVVYNNDETEHTVTVRRRDRCDDEAREDTITVAADGFESTTVPLSIGGMYEITVAIDGGATKTEDLDTVCTRLDLSIQSGGEISIVRGNDV